MATKSGQSLPPAESYPKHADDLAAFLRERVWAYLAGSAAPTQIAALAEDIFALPRGDVRRLAAIHLLPSREAAAMLDAAERLLRELPSSIYRSRVELRGEV